MNFFLIKKLYCFINKIPLTVRFLIVFLYLSIGVNLASNTYGQSTEISISVRNETIGSILEAVERQTEFTFVYDSKMVNVKRKTSVQASRKNVFDVLNQVFSNTDIAYTIMNKKIILNNQKDLSIIASQQRIRITGVVIDENKMPIPGVSVSVKGTTIGIITDVDGVYSIHVPDEDAVLVFSFIGYATSEYTVGSQKEINVSMSEDTHLIEEVVVIGYGTSRKKDVTGSVASVKADELNSVASSSVSQMLQGKVAGMNSIQHSSQPGAGMSVTIRGAASPNGSNSPLYVIDGVPLLTNSSGTPEINVSPSIYDYRSGVDRDPLNSINPNDIESIEILKDASAAAIYGASAANGVVLITTKSGKAGRAKVDYRGTFTTQIAKKYPEMLNAREFREQANLWTKEYFLYQNKMGVYGTIEPDFSGYTPVFSDVNGYTADTNWMDELMRSGYITDHSISVNGGRDKTRYFASYNYYDNVGLLKNSDLERHSIRLNLDQDFSDRLKAGVKFNYSKIRSNSTSVGASGDGDNMVSNAMRFGPDIVVKDENGEYTDSHNKLTNNPVGFLEIEDLTSTERIFIAPTIEIKLFDGLSLRGVGGYDNQFGTRDFFLPVKAKNRKVPEGMAQLSNYSVSNLSGEGYLNFEKTYNNIHRVSGVLGAGYYKTRENSFNLTGLGFFTDAFGTANVGIADQKDKGTISSYRSERVKLSQFVRINYSLMDKYIATFTARRDGSSYFAENNKWGIFPSASVAWRVNEEAFMKNKTPFSDLKIRMGYGTVGNENVLGTNSQTLYKSGYNYLIGSTMQTGLALVQIENPNLKWETNYTLNLGLDYGLFNQRVTGSIEFYHRGVKDLLDYQKLPSNNAVGRVAANIGETQSRGFEFSLRSANLKSTKVNWETTFDLSYFKTNWVKRNPEVALADYIGEKDELDAIYGWKTDGIITSPSEMPSYMPDAMIGNVKYVDVNGDGTLDSKDVVKLGNSLPRWLIGLGNTVSYKGFDLNFYFYAATGFKKTRGQIPGSGSIGNNGAAAGNTYKTIMTDVYNSQTGYGWMPGVATNVYSSSNPSGNSDFYLMNGSYVKLKNITLGYTLQQNIFTSGRFLQGVRVFVDAQNVATFTGYKGFDPELSTDNPYPQAFSLSFGVNLSF